MGNKIIHKDRMADLIGDLMEGSEVIAPVVKGKQVFFKPIASAEDVSWEFGNSTVSPTEYIIPQSEVVFQYKQRGTDVSVQYQVEETQRTIIGIRPCDVHGLRMMDRVFKGKFPDPYYLTRRKNTTLIAMECSDPCASCFCSSFDTGPNVEDGAGADIGLTDLGETYYVRVFTERGQALVERSANLFTESTEQDDAARQQVVAEAKGKIRRTLEVDGLADALGKMFESDYWLKISSKCIECGSCTYLCPVCYCFDVTDSCNHISEGERVRCWDACTFKSFAMLSGGHNPRPTIKENYRQKMYHKFLFAVQRYDEPLCVGCGRCLVSCPVHLDIVRVLNEAKQEVV